MRPRPRKDGSTRTRKIPETRRYSGRLRSSWDPSRGRAGFELKPDGELVESRIAAVDGSLKQTGKWKLSETGKLYFYRDDPATPAKVLEIESVSKDKLVVKR